MYFIYSIGWNDIAYSFLIGGDGRVYEGRGWDRVGSHTLHYDYVSLAVSFMGNFNNTMPAPAALAAADKLLMCAMQRKAITPSYSLYGHQDVRDTECPGYTLYNAIRKWTHYNVTTGKPIEIRISAYCIYGHGWHIYDQFIFVEYFINKIYS